MVDQDNPLAVGIDLGTTYSCIAYIDEFGKPVVLKNFEGDSTTPSVVLFPEGSDEIVVGKIAKQEKVMASPDRIVEFAKRSMGQSNRQFLIEDMEYRPEQISAFVLKKVVQDAEVVLGRPIEQAVITCPAYFGINEREATAHAGELAGLKGYAEDGKVNIISEPTAAAFYYGLEKANRNELVLVFDLGGGTFDATLLAIRENGLEAICIGGDHELGGKDWDDLLTAYCLDVAAEEGVDVDAVCGDSRVLGDLQLRVESAKQALSGREKTTIPFVFEGTPIRIEITREKFDELTRNKLERAIALCQDMIGEAKQKGYAAFDRILLVGGSTKMTQVRSRLEQEFPGVPIEFNEPDEAVAKGAALFAQKLLIDRHISDELFRLVGDQQEDKGFEEIAAENPEAVKRAAETVSQIVGLPTPRVEELAKKKVINVTSKSFGIVVVTDVATYKEMTSNLILKNGTLPAKITKSFSTIEANQGSAELRIMESVLTEEVIEPELSQEIGRAVLPLPPGLAAGSPIEVTFDLDSAGLLRYHGRDLSSNEHIEGEIQTSGGVMTQEELEDAKEQSKLVTIA